MTYGEKLTVVSLAGAIALVAIGPMAAVAQQNNAEAEAQIIEADEELATSEFVTINVKDANISEVLKAYSLQTGQSIVVGPDVVSESVNVRLNNIPWEEALDVILKPYGFGYRVVGDTIVISKLENIVTVEGIEPLMTKVFKLRYIDAYDIMDICSAQLSGRGKFTILQTKSMPGWEFGGEGTGGAAVESGIRARRETQEEIKKSKTLVITDVPSSITKIDKLIAEVDMLPAQVMIESKFIELTSDAGSQIGLDYFGAIENVNSYSGVSSSLEPTTLTDLDRILNTTTGYPDPLSMGAAGSLSQDSGLHLSHTILGDSGFELLFNMIAQDDSANVLSAPKLLTVNNQEAALLVGSKYPIIESSNNSGGGSSSTTSTRLDYYENIGIQLNVIPQVCDDDYINMIVHPAVSEISTFASSRVYSGSDSASGTDYPVLRIREAETQVMIKSGNVAVIGGLQEERDTVTIEKIPLLSDIPFLGRLFRNETLRKEKVDLLIFIKATIVDNDAHAIDSASKVENYEARVNMDITKKLRAEKVLAVETEATQVEAAKTANTEILELVKQMDGTPAPAAVSTNSVPVN